MPMSGLENIYINHVIEIEEYIKAENIYSIYIRDFFFLLFFYKLI